MDLIRAIIDCIRGPSGSEDYPTFVDEKSKPLQPSLGTVRKLDAIAAEIVEILRTAEKPGSYLASRLDDAVEGQGWTENIAKTVLEALVKLIQQGNAVLGRAMQDAVDRAHDIAMKIFEFAKDHPVIFCTIIALGVLVILSPWVIEALGFGELGPIEGCFAALWQSRYAGYVPKGSLFSFFQRLGMTW